MFNAYYQVIIIIIIIIIIKKLCSILETKKAAVFDLA